MKLLAHPKMRCYLFTRALQTLWEHSPADVLLNVVPTNSKDGTTVAVAGVTHQHIDLELGEVPDLEGFCQREGTQVQRGSTRGPATCAEGVDPEVPWCVYKYV